MATIRSWDDVNRTLGALAVLHRDLTTFGTERDEAIQRAKTAYVDKAKPVEALIGELEDALRRFVVGHQGELDGRSRKLEHGRVGLLLVTALKIGSRNVKGAVAWLVENGKRKFLHVKHELNREALREAPDDVLRAIKARVEDDDQFWYEVDGERHAVEAD